MDIRDPKTGVQLAIAAAGSQTALAALLKITPQAVQQWGKIPAGRVRHVARATRLPLHMLRPDLYDPPEGRAA